MAVVARCLVRAQCHHAARLLESHAGADNAVNDPDGTGIDDHGGPAFGNESGFLVCAVREVDCDERFIQIAQFIQKGGGPLAIALDDLIGRPAVHAYGFLYPAP